MGTLTCLCQNPTYLPGLSANEFLLLPREVARSMSEMVDERALTDKDFVTMCNIEAQTVKRCSHCGRLYIYYFDEEGETDEALKAVDSFPLRDEAEALCACRNADRSAMLLVPSGALMDFADAMIRGMVTGREVGAFFSERASEALQCEDCGRLLLRNAEKQTVTIYELDNVSDWDND